MTTLSSHKNPASLCMDCMPSWNPLTSPAPEPTDECGEAFPSSPQVQPQRLQPPWGRDSCRSCFVRDLFPGERPPCLPAPGFPPTPAFSTVIITATTLLRSWRAALILSLTCRRCVRMDQDDVSTGEKSASNPESQPRSRGGFPSYSLSAFLSETQKDFTVNVQAS